MANFYGRFGSRPAVSYQIFGHRAGAHSTSVIQDVGEFLGTTTDTFPELVGTENLEVVSSSASDSAAGVGTRTILITYLDVAGHLQVSPPIALNGLTAVALSFKALFIYWMEALTGGTSDSAVGNISLRIAGGGVVQEQILAGRNRSQSCRFMVPAGFRAHIQFWSASAVGGGVFDCSFQTTALMNGALGAKYMARSNNIITVGLTQASVPWTVLPALSKLKISAFFSQAAVAQQIDAAVSIFLVLT